MWHIKKFGKPIKKSNIPLETRLLATGKCGPFNANGDVQQGYFFVAPASLVAAIEKLLI